MSILVWSVVTSDGRHQITRTKAMVSSRRRSDRVLRPLAVPERFDDLSVPYPHEVHASVVLGAADSPADDSPVTVDVDVFDLEPDRGVGDQPLPAGEAFVVSGPDFAVGRRTGSLHDALIGDDVDELLGCAFSEGGVELVDDCRGVGHACIVPSGRPSSDSLEGMALMSDVRDRLFIGLSFFKKL